MKKHMIMAITPTMVKNLRTHAQARARCRCPRASTRRARAGAHSVSRSDAEVLDSISACVSMACVLSLLKYTLCAHSGLRAQKARRRGARTAAR